MNSDRIKIVSINVGKPSKAKSAAVRKWFAEQDAHIICLQEANELVFSIVQGLALGHFPGDSADLNLVKVVARTAPAACILQLLACVRNFPTITYLSDFLGYDAWSRRADGRLCRNRTLVCNPSTHADPVKRAWGVNRTLWTTHVSLRGLEHLPLTLHNVHFTSGPKVTLSMNQNVVACQGCSLTAST